MRTIIHKFVLMQAAEVAVAVEAHQARRKNLTLTERLQDVVADIKDVVMMRLFVFTCLASVLNFGCAQKKAIEDKGKPDGCLDYSFGKEYPDKFKFYKDKIIIGDGRRLIGFNRSGKEVSRIVFPSSFAEGFPFLDFIPLNDTSYLVALLQDLYEVTPNTQKLLHPKLGELIRREGSIVAANFQESDTASNITNGIKFFDLRSTSSFKYPTKKDLATANFEITDANIALSIDYAFCLVPLDTTKKIRVFENPFAPSTEYHTFLGIDQGDYVFLTHDFEKNEDHLHFYDIKMKVVKEAILDVSYNDLIDEVKGNMKSHMEAPFGNFYTFDKSSSTVYVFRHTKKKGICYFPIENHLRVIKKAN